MDIPEASDTDPIKLSPVTEALLKALTAPAAKQSIVEGDQYKVSQAVSFFGFAYEKIRNAIEFNEEHLIRRMAIARILRRRLAINPKGENEGENLMRELLWGRYVPENGVSVHDVESIQHIINQYQFFFTYIRSTHKVKNVDNLGEIVMNLMSCEIEETVSKDQAGKQSALVYYFFQVLKNKVSLENIDETKKDMYFYAAVEKGFAKNDKPFIIYHFFTLKYGTLHEKSKEEIQTIASEFSAFMGEANEALKNKHSETLVKFVKKQVPPFKILYGIIRKNQGAAKVILSKKGSLRQEVEELCKEKYTLTSVKLRNAAVRSITYIFLTKMVFVLLIEIPLSKLFYDDIELASVAINTLLPPVMMGVIVSIIAPPSKKNTERIYERIVDIIDDDRAFEDQKSLITTNAPQRRSGLIFLFTILYLTSFSLILGSVYYFLDVLGFNLVSKSIFIFFISVVTFFAYRIRQTAKEYVLEPSNNVVISFVTFLFLPILYLGKMFSEQVSKINLFIIFFDYLIEAPFKFIIDIVEEWTKFLRDRKDELA
ncbi:hypothetical protein KBC70_03040 [Candidatus Woesebacteria bacterium]|nr:hypothetical protein [Candidatus Woesebacteria bacterium]